MIASQQGHADIVELLIENHADLDMQDQVPSAILVYKIITYKCVNASPMVILCTTNLLHVEGQNMMRMRENLHGLHAC